MGKKLYQIYALLMEIWTKYLQYSVVFIMFILTDRGYVLRIWWAHKKLLQNYIFEFSFNSAWHNKLGGNIISELNIIELLKNIQCQINLLFWVYIIPT